MTTWQDQQPQSRRALRERERAHTQVPMADSGEQESPDTGFDQQIWATQHTQSSSEFTPTMPNPPQSEAPLRRPRQSGSRRTESDLPPTESPAYRLRDFSPETRGASFSSTQSAQWTPPAPGSEDLGYHTSADANRPPFVPPVAPTPVPPIVVTSDEVWGSDRAAAPTAPEVHLEHTLSRRELRELRQAAEQQEANQAVQAPVAPPLVTPPSTVPESPAPPFATPQAATPDTAPPADSVPPPATRRRARTQSDELAAAMTQFDTVFQNDSGAGIPPLVESSVGPVWTPEEQPAPPAPEARPAPVYPSAPSAPVVTQAEPLREVVTAPEVYTAPVGHWSNQSAIDESVGSTGLPHKRDIGSSDAITTSALVLPNFPASMPNTGPVRGTGEFLMTGSINLPRSLGVTGLHPSRYDRSDIDEIIDAGDRDASAPDSAPVRAVRAVSTYTSTQGIINAKRPKGNNLPMVLSITAGVMMVGVVVLVVVGMIFKIF